MRRRTGWISALTAVALIMPMVTALPAQGRPQDTTTYGTAATESIIASLYPYGGHPASQCFKLWTSTRDKRWVLVDYSDYGIANAARCDVSDGWMYARKVGTQWYFLKYTGSSFDSCAARVKYLAREGMPREVAKDIERGFSGCWR